MLGLDYDSNEEVPVEVKDEKKKRKRKKTKIVVGLDEMLKGAGEVEREFEQAKRAKVDVAEEDSGEEAAMPEELAAALKMQEEAEKQDLQDENVLTEMNNFMSDIREPLPGGDEDEEGQPGKEKKKKNKIDWKEKKRLTKERKERERANIVKRKAREEKRLQEEEATPATAADPWEASSYNERKGFLKKSDD